ncbi:MAG TPA: thioredoxin domain-containing protein [Vicinamibacteria bacterium]|nr:thioredoxin domain-containing protein [Vicinamibacteria bacterium]
MERLEDRTWDASVLGSLEPVAVVFWAEWCLPSRTAAEAIEALAAPRRGSLRLGVLNVDENPRTTERYEIQGLPTLIVFHGAQPAERRVGLMSRADVGRLLDRHA